MNLNLNHLKKCEDDLLVILEMLDDKLSPEQSPETDNIEEIIGYGIELANLSGNSAKAIADAKELLLKRELLFMKGNEALWDKPTVLKKMMDGHLAENHKMVVWSDRINAAIGHKLDFFRSVVSKYKEEMKLSQMQQFNANKVG